MTHMTVREHRLMLLEAIRVALDREGPVRLSDTQRQYLRDVCDKALSGDRDPLQIDCKAGGQSDRRASLAEAKAVHRLVKAGTPVARAYRSVGEATNRDGTSSGAVAKNYRKHRGELEAADRFYAARAAGLPPDLADIEAILAPKSEGK